MPKVTAQIEVKAACDTSYRASNLETHLTHGCIALFRRLWSAPSARSNCRGANYGAFVGFFERADGALGEGTS